jgi:flavin reductase (DIM6/NTAB) family NADH-FMN oxidoreductase RutF
MQREVDYSEAIVTKYPEQIVVAIAKDTTGKYNPITLGWTMLASGTPPMMAVAIAKKQWSIQAIRHAKEFVIAFPSEHQQQEVLLFGTRSGRDCDKLAEADANTVPAKDKTTGFTLSPTMRRAIPCRTEPAALVGR